MTENEKITINLGVVDLAQIDVLVEQGIYANRSDFIRIAIRKQLEANEKNVQFNLSRMSSPLLLATSVENKKITIVGICRIGKGELEALLREGQKMSVAVVGMLSFDKAITPELFQATVERVAIKGKLVASPEIKAIVQAMD